MAPLAPTFTSRYRAKYRAAGVVHNLLFHSTTGASHDDLLFFHGVAHDIFAAWDDQLADDFEWIEVQTCLADEDVFVLASSVPTAVTGLVDAATFTGMGKATGTRWYGKSSGRKTSLTMYGIFWDPYNIEDPSANGVVTAAEVGAVGTVAAALSSIVHAIDGNIANYVDQATVKCNDHLLAKVRSGAIS